MLPGCPRLKPQASELVLLYPHAAGTAGKFLLPCDIPFELEAFLKR